jgi:hypothetical protein
VRGARAYVHPPAFVNISVLMIRASLSSRAINRANTRKTNSPGFVPASPREIRANAFSADDARPGARENIQQPPGEHSPGVRVIIPRHRLPIVPDSRVAGRGSQDSSRARSRKTSPGIVFERGAKEGREGRARRKGAIGTTSSRAARYCDEQLAIRQGVAAATAAS